MLCLCIISGFYLRLYDLGFQSLWIDEGYSINAAQAIIEKGAPVLESGKVYGKGLSASYVIASSLKVFGLDSFDPWSARIPSVIFGTLLIGAVYCMGRRIFNSHIIGVTSSVLIALSTWEIAWSRQARGYLGMQLFVVLSFLYIYKWLDFKKYKDLFIGFMFLAVAILFHSSATLFLIPLVPLLLFHLVKEGGYREKGFILMTTGMFIFATAGFILFAPTPFEFKPSPLYLNYIKDHLLVLSGFVMMAPLLALYDPLNRRSVLFISTSIILPFTFLTLFHYSIQVRYLLTIFPLMLMLGSYSILQIVKKLRFKSESHVNLLSCGLTLIILFPLLTIVPTKSYPLEKGSPQPNFGEAYKIIKKTKMDGDIVISPYTHLSKIYLNDAGLWLPISLTAKTNEISQNTVDGRDYYTGAPKINSIEELKYNFNIRSGYLVIDELARVRLGIKTAEAIEASGLKEIYHSGKELNEIWVYRF